MKKTKHLIIVTSIILGLTSCEMTATKVAGLYNGTYTHNSTVYNGATLSASSAGTNKIDVSMSASGAPTMTVENVIVKQEGNDYVFSGGSLIDDVSGSLSGNTINFHLGNAWGTSSFSGSK